MKKTNLDSFDTLTDVIDEVDGLLEKAKRCKDRKEKKTILAEAQTLADAYQTHCENGGNNVQQFNQFV